MLTILSTPQSWHLLTCILSCCQNVEVVAELRPLICQWPNLSWNWRAVDICKYSSDIKASHELKNVDQGDRVKDRKRYDEGKDGNNKTGDNICVIGDSMIKHIIRSNISLTNNACFFAFWSNSRPYWLL